MDLEVDVQCYSEVNANMLQPKIRHQFYTYTKSMDNTSKAMWSNSDIACPTNYKPGGTGIVTRGASSSRIKESNNDKFGRWSYQIIDGKEKRDVMIINIYQCCKSSTSEGLITAH